jgi:hypothetical protein
MEWLSDTEFVINGKVFQTYNRPWIENLVKFIDMDRIYENKNNTKVDKEEV